jgi:putative ubiquitin-RnfH superfamily antitoxin RatB of RatAB toxin-antitoxin module
MASADAAPGLIRVEVVFAAGPHRIDHARLELPAGSTLAEALRASGLAQRHAPELIDSLRTGIWGKAADLQTPLRDRDRVELYRPLQVDPKEARRQRYRRDGVKRAPKAAPPR